MSTGSAASGAIDGSRQLTAWVVRGGEHGETVEYNLEHGVVTLGWGNWVADVGVATFEDENALGRYIEEHVTDEEADVNRRGRGRRRIWRFWHEVEIGDVVVLPLKIPGMPERHIAIGRVTGPAQTDDGWPPDTRLRRSVKWLSREVPRADARKDLRGSIGSGGTLFRLGRMTLQSELFTSIDFFTSLDMT